MLRTLLTVLDDSPANSVVLDLAIRWAKRFDALLVGVGVVDEPGVHGSDELLVGESYFRAIDRQLVDDLRRAAEGVLSQAAVRCAEAGVAFKPLESYGRPADVVREEAQRFDLLLVGRATRLRADARDEPAELAGRILKDSPRPVVVVPETLDNGESVVIAYDGSIPAARALAAFEASGLGRDRDVWVVSIAPDGLAAGRRADRAVEFLRSHEISAHGRPEVGGESPAPFIVRQARDLSAGLIVAGAYGQSALRDFFIGSTTRSLLRESPAPLFIYH